MEEMLPIASGMVLGGLLAVTRLPVYVRMMLVAVLAVCATLASGEYRLSWGFLLADVAEVGTSCAVTFLGVKAWGRLARRSDGR